MINFSLIISFVKNSLIVTLPEYISVGVLFSIVALISRNFSVEVVGEYSFAYICGQIVASILGGSTLNVMRRDFTLSDEIKRQYLLSIYFYRLVFFLITILLALVAYLLQGLNLVIFLMLFARLVDALSDTYYYSLMSENRFNRYSIIKSSQYTTLLFFIYTGCHLHYSLTLLCTIFLFNSLIFASLNFILIWWDDSYEQKVYLQADYLKDLLKRTIPLFFSSSIYILSSRANILVVKNWCSPTEFGLFSLVINVMTIFTIFINALSSLLLNHQINSYKTSLKSLYQFTYKITLLLLPFGLLSTLFLYFSADYITLIFKSHREFTHYVQWASLALIPFVLQIPVNYMFTILDKNKLALIFSIIMLVCAVIIYIVGTYWYALDGAIIAFIAYSAFWCLSAHLVSIFLLKNNPLKPHKMFAE